MNININGQRTKIVATKLYGYAFLFGSLSFEHAIDNVGELHITSWDQMKVDRWKESVSTNHKQELFHKLHNLSQNSSNVQENT